MKYLILLTVIIYSTYSNSQSYKIEYERISFKEYDGGKNRINLTTLLFNNEKSIFIEDMVVNGYSTELSIEDYSANKKGKKILGDSLGQVIIKYLNKGVYKQRKKAADYKKSIYVNVNDSIIPNFNWSLKNYFKKVLGYKVQKATTNYMDREITAWFTEDINISDGPWKFSNLPGLILEVTIQLTIDTKLKYEAISLIRLDNLPDINFPNTRKQSLKVVEENYITKYKNLFKYYKTKSDGQVSLRKDDLDFKPIVFNEE